MTKEEFTGLIEANGKAVYSFCCHLTGSRELADDLYQDTFLKAWELCLKMEKSGNPKSYVMGIAVKLWQNQRRKQLTRQKKVPMQEYYDYIRRKETTEFDNVPEQEMLREEQRQEVRRIVSALPEKMRLVLYLFYTMELSLQEISDVLHIPVGTVKSRLNKGRNQVRRRMEVYRDETVEDR